MFFLTYIFKKGRMFSFILTRGSRGRVTLFSSWWLMTFFCLSLHLIQLISELMAFLACHFENERNVIWKFLIFPSCFFVFIFGMFSNLYSSNFPNYFAFIINNKLVAYDNTNNFASDCAFNTFQIVYLFFWSDGLSQNIDLQECLFFDFRKN